MWHSVWLLLLVSGAYASEDAPLGNSCTCRPSSECPTDNQVLEENSSVSSTFCENNLIKCCDIAGIPQDEQTRRQHNLSEQPAEARTPFEIDLIARVMNKIYSMVYPPKEPLTSDAGITVLPEIQSFVTLEKPKQDIVNEEEVHSITAKPNEDFGRNILINVTDVIPPIEKNQNLRVSTKSEQQMKEQENILSPTSPQAIRVRILNHLPSQITGRPVAFSPFGHPEANRQVVHYQHQEKRDPTKTMNADNNKALRNDRVTQDEENIERLIDQTSSFESMKTLPKTTDSLEFRWKILRKRNNLHQKAESPKPLEAQEEYEELSKVIRSFESRKEENSHAMEKERSLKEDTDITLKLRVEDVSKDKSSFGTLLSLDQASTQTADESTSNNISKHTLSANDTSSVTYLNEESNKNVSRLRQIEEVQSLSEHKNSDLETVGNNETLEEPRKSLIGSKYLSRSRGSHKTQKTNSGDTDLQGENKEHTENKNLTETVVTIATTVGRFRRPPRVLPRRSQSQYFRNGSNKFKNAKERTVDLFNRSDKSKSRASLIINRRERNMTKS